MVDYVRIKITAGKGGDGHMSFFRQKGKPYGVPEGGDGGAGGDVYLVPSKDLNTLAPYRYKKDFEAAEGEDGGRNNKTGAEAPDLLLEVPLGTLIKDKDDEVIFDLTSLDQRVMVAKGGEGGRGNIHLRQVVKARRAAGERGFVKANEPGFPGETVELTLELKLLADIGLVGLPNAGKSTLISKLTAARPKIADYPFTTLEPNLGVLTVERKEIVIADIPGLIEGASSGKGLGDQFLRHLERTRLLLHLVSLESASAWEDYLTINKELDSYSQKLKEIPQIILLTKSDLADEGQIKEINKIFKNKKIKTLIISAISELGLEELKKEIVKQLR